MLTLADILDRNARSPAPGPRGHPILGSLPRARRDPIALFMDSFRDYGEVVRFRFGSMVGHLVSSPADRKSTRLNSSHGYISYAVFCLKKKKKKERENA